MKHSDSGVGKRQLDKDAERYIYEWHACHEIANTNSFTMKWWYKSNFIGGRYSFNCGEKIFHCVICIFETSFCLFNAALDGFNLILEPIRVVVSTRNPALSLRWAVFGTTGKGFWASLQRGFRSLPVMSLINGISVLGWFHILPWLCLKCSSIWALDLDVGSEHTVIEMAAADLGSTRDSSAIEMAAADLGSPRDGAVLEDS